MYLLRHRSLRPLTSLPSKMALSPRKIGAAASPPTHGAAADSSPNDLLLDRAITEIAISNSTNFKNMRMESLAMLRELQEAQSKYRDLVAKCRRDTSTAATRMFVVAFSFAASAFLIEE